MYRDPYEQQQIVAEMTAAIERDPSNPQAYFRRGNAFSNLGQYEQAKIDMDQVIELEPLNAMVYNNRGARTCARQMWKPRLTISTAPSSSTRIIKKRISIEA